MRNQKPYNVSDTFGDAFRRMGERYKQEKVTGGDQREEETL